MSNVTLKKQLEFFLKGGNTKRYHTVDMQRQQNVAEHSCFVAIIIGMLYFDINESEEIKNLMIWALFHDMAEGGVGDVASPVKRAAPMLKALLDRAENDEFNKVGIIQPKLSDRAYRMFKMADNFEGLLFCANEIRRGNSLAKEAYNNYKSYILKLNPEGHEETLFKLIKEMANDRGK